MFLRKKAPWEIAAVRRVIQHRLAARCELGVTPDGQRCPHPDCEFNAARPGRRDTPETKAKVAAYMTKHKLVIASLMLAVLLGAPACASLPAKQVAVVSTAGLETAVGAFQDAEVGVCGAAPASPNVCASSSVLSSGAHQKLSQGIAATLRDILAAGPLLKAWQPGTVMPAGLSTILTDAAALFTQLASQIPGGSTVATAIQTTVSTAATSASTLATQAQSVLALVQSFANVPATIQTLLTKGQSILTQIQAVAAALK